MNNIEIQNYIAYHFSEDVKSIRISADNAIILQVSPKIHLGLIYELKNSPIDLCQLVSICGVDYPSQEQRYCIVYNFLSIRHAVRIRIEVYPEDNLNPQIESLCGVFRNAGWYEREVWDMYGVKFIGNSDLRRILTDYNFTGHPLRKDFPLTGFEEVRYDNSQGKVVYEKVRLQQEFRNFDTLSPWNEIDLPSNINDVDKLQDPPSS